MKALTLTTALVLSATLGGNAYADYYSDRANDQIRYQQLQQQQEIQHQQQQMEIQHQQQQMEINRLEQQQRQEQFQRGSDNGRSNPHMNEIRSWLR